MSDAAVELTHETFLARLADLAQQLTRAAEAIKERAAEMMDDARDVQRTADQIGEKKVSQATIGETRELSSTLDGVCAAIDHYSSSASDLARQVSGAEQEVRTVHGGIAEAYNRSPDPAGDSSWYDQE